MPGGANIPQKETLGRERIKKGEKRKGEKERHKTSTKCKDVCGVSVLSENVRVFVFYNGTV